MMRARFAVLLSSVLLASLAAGGAATAEQAKAGTPAKPVKPVKLDAKGELVVKLIGTSAPSGLDAKATTSLSAIVEKLKTNDVEGALAAWKSFVEANAKKLGKGGITQSSHWVLRMALLEPVDDLVDPADKVRFARDAKAKAKTGLVALQNAKKEADKSSKPVSVKVVKVATYQKAKAAATESTAKLTKVQIDAQTDQLKNDLDSMSEMGEMESLRLQMAMDRMSKMMSTLSNILKKMSDTAQTITANLK